MEHAAERGDSAGIGIELEQYGIQENGQILPQCNRYRLNPFNKLTIVWAVRQTFEVAASRRWFSRLARRRMRPEVQPNASTNEGRELSCGLFVARVRKYQFMKCGHEGESQGEGDHKRYSRLLKEEFEQDRTDSEDEKG